MTNSGDIMADFKHSLFVTVPPELGIGSNLIVLTDVKFWNDHYDELISWCNEQNLKPEGMTITFDNENQSLLFILRWL